MSLLRLPMIFFLLALGGCAQSGTNAIEIKNGGDVPLTDVGVDVGGKRLQVDSIKPGEVARIAFEPVSDSGVQISYRKGAESRIHSCSGDVYVTTGLAQHLLVTIATDACQVKEAL